MQMGKWVSRLLSLWSTGCGEEGRVSGAWAQGRDGEAQKGLAGALTFKPASAAAVSWGWRSVSCPVCESRRGGEGGGDVELSDSPPKTSFSPRGRCPGAQLASQEWPCRLAFSPPPSGSSSCRRIPDPSPSLTSWGHHPPWPGCHPRLYQVSLRLAPSIPFVPHTLSVGLKAWRPLKSLSLRPSPQCQRLC